MNTAWQTPVSQFNNWLLAAGRQPSTIQTRTRWINSLIRTYPDKTPFTISTEEIQTWLANPDWKPASRKGALASVRRFFHYLEITEQRTKNPTKTLLSVKTPRYQSRPTPDSVLQQALENATTSEESLMLLLAAYAGLRRFEIAKLHTSDRINNWLQIRGKGGHTRLIPIHHELVPYLDLKTTGYYFPGRFEGCRSSDFIGKRISKLLSGQHTAHTLRHWFGTTAYRQTKDIRVVQELMGHADVRTTQTYIGITDNALEEAINALPTYTV